MLRGRASIVQKPLPGRNGSLSRNHTLKAMRVINEMVRKERRVNRDKRQGAHIVVANSCPPMMSTASQLTSTPHTPQHIVNRDRGTTRATSTSDVGRRGSVHTTTRGSAFPQGHRRHTSDHSKPWATIDHSNSWAKIKQCEKTVAALPGRAQVTHQQWP